MGPLTCRADARLLPAALSEFFVCLARNSMAIDLPRRGKKEQTDVGAIANCGRSNDAQTTVNQ
eukprot:7958085-Lingulodinium_polyedra.AAC.1